MFVHHFLYTPLIRLLLPYALWRILKRYPHAAPWREYFGFCPPVKDDTSPLVWIHTVSVGEAVAAKALTQRLCDDGYRLLLTHTTASGRAWLKKNHPTATITALPLDLPGMVRRFFARSQPQVGIIVEAEYWPNLLLTAKKNNIKLLLANARLGKKNARRYRLISPLMRQVVGSFDNITAQTARDAGRLRCYGTHHISTAGNLKFDLPAANLPPHRLTAKTTLLLAATRPGEEAILLSAMDDAFLRDHFIILAPRHPERRQEIISLLQKRRLSYALHSKHELITDQTTVYLADTLGEMDKWYAACDAALIGGSVLPYGGQNPIEAMQAGVPAVIGQHVDNYTKLVRRAVARHALVQAADVKDAITHLQRLAHADRQQIQAAAQAFCRSQGGALEKNLYAVRQLLPPPSGASG